MPAPRPILLVEDDEVDVLTVRRALRDLEIPNPLRVAGDGEQALALLRDADEPRPILILLDLNLPRMGGLEFLRAVRRQGSADRIPIIILTTSRRQQDVEAGFDQHVAGYIVKPLEYPKFVEVMTTIDRYWKISELPA